MRHYLLFALVFLSSSPRHIDKGISVETIELMKHAIVPVVCGYVDNQHHFQLVAIAGSGFFVDPDGRFMTARHVLENWQNISASRRPCTPAIYIPKDGWGDFERDIPVHSFSFSTCQQDQSIDLVVCSPLENPFRNSTVKNAQIRPVTFNTNPLPDGTNVAFTGFPLEYTFPITSKVNIAGRRSIEKSDIGFDYVLDKGAWPGASGSPVYDSDGKVIGIVLQRGINEGVGLAYARSAITMVDFLRKNPVEKGEQDGK